MLTSQDDYLRRKVLSLIPRLTFKFPYTAEEWTQNLYVENYHKHTDYSNNYVTDSAENIQSYAIRGKEYGAKCLFSGEHGSQGNQFETYKTAKQYGLKYRHSAEVYWVKDRFEKDRTNCHMVIVAKNEEGRRDLNYIISMANLDGYYYYPRIDLELLLNVNPNNFIVTTACVAGWKYEDAEEIWARIARHFKGNFFCEIQAHNTKKQKELNRRILNFAKEYNLPIICGLDSHYVDKENERKRLLMLEEKGIEYDDDESGWDMDYPDSKEIIQRLLNQRVLTEEEILLSLMNTNVFVNECEDIQLDTHFKIPNIYPDLDYEGRVRLFKKIVQDEYKKDPLKSKEKIQGIKWEAQQYFDSKTVDYPLFSREVVRLAVEKYGGVLTTTSRGSAASFVTNKYMGLTTIDRFNAEIPIYPERFLTKDRIMAGTLPDVDLNLKDQAPFVQASRELLGEHGCYPLMTLSKMKEKSAWKMYSRVRNVSPSEADVISKSLDKYNEALKYADEEERKTIQPSDYIPEKYLSLYQESVSFQNTTVKCGVHACGHLCFAGDIRREVGLISAVNETTKKRTIAAAVEGQYLDEFGYVKEDFLIVDVVGLIDELFASIGQKVPSFEKLKEMVKDDPKTWEIYEKGLVCCINQCEKASTRSKAMIYKPKTIGELSAFVAGIRPGFMSLVNGFLRREKYSTGEPEIDTILEDSSHYMLYQESIMKVLNFLGLKMTETYSIIKSISKKKLKGEKKENLLKELERGWMEKFGNLDNFNRIWKVIEDSASYGFNCCVSGDTKILRGAKSGHKFEPTVEEMYLIRNDLDYAKKTNHVSLRTKFHRYGYGSALSMFDDGRIRVNQIVDIRESGVQEIYRVTAENGSYVDCTMNHKFPTPDRGEVKLEDLKAGDWLYAKEEYEKTDKQYVKRYQKGIPTCVVKIASIEYLRTDKTYDIEMSDPAHNFITESGLVVSNSHAYSMAGDSLYCAWFKAHYPAKFYEVAINHYQNKKTAKKDKIKELLKEAKDGFGYQIADFEYGHDNRAVNVDDNSKTINSNLSSIKGVKKQTADQLWKLYCEHDQEIQSFTDFLYCSSKFIKLPSDQIEILIKLNYFKRFGSPNKLFELLRLFKRLSGSVQPNKLSLVADGISLDIAREFADRETDKTLKGFRAYDFIKYMEENLEDVPITRAQKLAYQILVLEDITYVDPDEDKEIFFVIDIDVKAKLSIMHCYSLRTGKTIQFKYWNTAPFAKNVDKFCLVRIADISRKNKVRLATVEEMEATGKKFVNIPDQFEYWIDRAVIIERVNTDCD